jgi:DedD protein
MEEKKTDGVNNQELNNIILDSVEEETVSNSKKTLMIGAALVVVFFIAVGVLRTVGGDDDKKKNNMILPPEPTKKVDQSPIFEKVPVKDSAEMDEKFEKIIKEIKQKTEPEPRVEPKPVVASTPKPVEPTRPAINRNVPKEEVIAKEPRYVAPAGAVSDTKSGFYIQVGAFYSLQPSTKLLNNIKAEGFNYDIYKTKVNSKNITKVIIGPYNTKTEAKNNLTSVREKINKSAYILKVK